MTIPEAVLLVLQAGAMSRGGEIFLLDMGKPIRLLDLARQMVKLSGLRDEDIPIKFIGLRPGEKLEEEFSFPYETLLPTDQPKLSRLESPYMVPLDLPSKIQQLKKLGIGMDFEGIQRTLQDVVPEYRPMIPVQQNLSARPRRALTCKRPPSISLSASGCHRSRCLWWRRLSRRSSGPIGW